MIINRQSSNRRTEIVPGKICINHLSSRLSAYDHVHSDDVYSPEDEEALTRCEHDLSLTRKISQCTIYASLTQRRNDAELFRAGPSSFGAEQYPAPSMLDVDPISSPRTESPILLRDA